MATKHTKLEFDRIVLGENHRLTPADTMDDELKGLIRSIMDNGLLQPLVVRQERVRNPEEGQPHRKYTLIAGFRRHAAITKIREDDSSLFDQIPVTVWTGNDTDASLASLAENIDRKTLSHAELATELRRLETAGKTIADLMKRTPFSESKIRTYLRLAESLSDQSMLALHGGDITLAEARRIMSLDEDSQARVVGELIAIDAESARLDQLTLEEQEIDETPPAPATDGAKTEAEKPAPKKKPAKKKKTEKKQSKRDDETSKKRKETIDKATGRRSRPGSKEIVKVSEEIEALAKRNRLPANEAMVARKALAYCTGEATKDDLMLVLGSR